MSLSGCTRQDFHLDGPGWPQPLGVHRNEHLPRVCPTALPSVPLCFLPRFLTLHPSFVYLLRTLTSREQPGFVLFTTIFSHLPSSTKCLVSLVAGLGLMAEHRLHAGGGRAPTPPSDWG